MTAKPTRHDWIAAALFAALALVSLAATPARADDTAPALTGDAENGASFFASACRRCHRDADRVATNLDPADAETVDALDDFLAAHHTRSDAERADLIAFLAAR
jgi:cytochrome c2